MTDLFKTKVTHQRFHPFKNIFKYSVLSMCINYDDLEILSKKLKIFSYNKFNLFSYYDKDHGYRDERSLKEYVHNFLKKNHIKFNNIKIKIICFPRILGYVFNPLSVIYCFEHSKLIAVFYEVKNTSNEQHTYCFASNQLKNKKEYIHKCNKNFYVSPFIGMKGIYHFYNSIPGDKISIIIDLYDEKQRKILTASQFGKKTSFNSFNLLKQLIFNPMISFKIISAIIYESFFIVTKGGKYYARKKKIEDTTSFEGKL